MSSRENRDVHGISEGLKSISHPGDLIKEEMIERGWSVVDLWLKMKNTQFEDLRATMDGRRAIDRWTARELGKAFGTGPEFWRNLQAAYDESNEINDRTTADCESELEKKEELEQKIKGAERLLDRCLEILPLVNGHPKQQVGELQVDIGQWMRE